MVCEQKKASRMSRGFMALQTAVLIKSKRLEWTVHEREITLW
jgi:hypothetical protein